MDTGLLLVIIGVFAILVILLMLVAVIIVLRQPDTNTPQESNTSTVYQNLDFDDSFDSSSFDSAGIEEPEEMTLTEFALADLSNQFRGTTQGRQREGMILHVSQPDTGLVAFASQLDSPTKAIIQAETVYGKMEVMISQGRAGVKWDDEPIGVLDYSNHRILGAEGQILGSMERPTLGGPSEGYYPVGFYGQQAAEVVMQFKGLSTLRWFGDQDNSDVSPAFQGIVDELEDVQTLMLLAVLLLEVGFFDMLAEVAG